MFISTVLAVAAICGAGVSAGAPKCGSDISSKLASLYPDGIPQKLMSSMMQYGTLYYQYVSADELNPFPVSAICITIELQTTSKAKATYKFPLTPAVPFSYAVTEMSPGIIQQNDAPNYKFIVLYFDPNSGVMAMQRCCDSCTGSGSGVGIMVAKSKIDQAGPQVEKALAVLAQLGYDKDLVKLSNCR